MLRLARSGAVLRIALNDQTSRNSLSESMMAALAKIFNEVETDSSINVLIIAADGPIFSSGHNLKELTARRADVDMGRAYFTKIFDQCATLMMQVATHRCVVIAEVNGLASAAGCQLVASCDLAYASDYARFCTPGVNIGLFCSTPMVALSRAIAPRHAREMLLTGDIFDSAFALRAGLVNGVYPQNDLTTQVMSLATRIATKSQRALGYGKPTYNIQSSRFV